MREADSSAFLTVKRVQHRPALILPTARLSSHMFFYASKISTEQEAQDSNNGDNAGISKRQFTSQQGHFNPSGSLPLLSKRYRFINKIAQGHSSVVIKAEDTFSKNKLVAIKVLQQELYPLGYQEMECLRNLNSYDYIRASGVIHLLDAFTFDVHFCMVFELFEEIPRDMFNPDSQDKKLKSIRSFTFHLLKTLGFLSQCKVIHADLKFENILYHNGIPVLIDFGNAIKCVYEQLSVYSELFQVQTLKYRAPEVLLGLHLGPEMDMWSLGCLLVELFRNKPLFMPKNETTMLQLMVNLLGPLPSQPYCRSKFYRRYSNFVKDATQENACQRLLKKLKLVHHDFSDFLAGCFQYDPSLRMTVQEAAVHPFLAPEFGLAYLIGSHHNGSFCKPAYSDVYCRYGSFQPPAVAKDRSVLATSYDLLKYGTSSGSYQTSDITYSLPRDGDRGDQIQLQGDLSHGRCSSKQGQVNTTANPSRRQIRSTNVAVTDNTDFPRLSFATAKLPDPLATSTPSLPIQRAMDKLHAASDRINSNTTPVNGESSNCPVDPNQSEVGGRTQLNVSKPSNRLLTYILSESHCISPESELHSSWHNSCDSVGTVLCDGKGNTKKRTSTSDTTQSLLAKGTSYSSGDCKASGEIRLVPVKRMRSCVQEPTQIMRQTEQRVGASFSLLQESKVTDNVGSIASDHNLKVMSSAKFTDNVGSIASGHNLKVMSSAKVTDNVGSIASDHNLKVISSTKVTDNVGSIASDHNLKVASSAKGTGNVGSIASDRNLKVTSSTTVRSITSDHNFKVPSTTMAERRKKCSAKRSHPEKVEKCHFEKSKSLPKNRNISTVADESADEIILLEVPSYTTYKQK